MAFDFTSSSWKRPSFRKSNSTASSTIDIDDAVVFALLQRSRLAGFDAYVVPQDSALPMANRREDILIIRP